MSDMDKAMEAVDKALKLIEGKGNNFNVALHFARNVYINIMINVMSHYHVPVEYLLADLEKIKTYVLEEIKEEG